MFLWGPPDPIVDVVSMAVFGVALGVLMVYLGGLMAVDICSKEVSGTVLGVVGVASYIGAGMQDIITGWLIEDSKVIVDGEAIYNFDAAGMLWFGSAVVSFLLAALVWNVRSPDWIMNNPESSSAFDLGGVIADLGDPREPSAWISQTKASGKSGELTERSRIRARRAGGS